MAATALLSIRLRTIRQAEVDATAGYRALTAAGITCTCGEASDDTADFPYFDVAASDATLAASILALVGIPRYALNVGCAAGADK